jgi:hypothetical protein
MRVFQVYGDPSETPVLYLLLLPDLVLFFRLVHPTYSLDRQFFISQICEPFLLLNLMVLVESLASSPS